MILQPYSLQEIQKFRRKLLTVSLKRVIQIKEEHQLFSRLSVWLLTLLPDFACITYVKYCKLWWFKKKEKANLEFCDFCVNLQTFIFH